VDRASLRWIRTERGRIYLRYLLASSASVVLGQTVLAVCYGVLRWSAEAANLAGFLAGGLSSFALHRRWTWGRTGRSRLMREIVPFWAIAVFGLLVSTWVVGVAADVAARVTDSRALQTGTVMASSLAVFGALWVVKFVIFDRCMFGVIRSDSTDRSPSRPSRRFEVPR
jgi:putative flippase GtrA